MAPTTDPRAPPHNFIVDLASKVLESWLQTNGRFPCGVLHSRQGDSWQHLELYFKSRNRHDVEQIPFIEEDPCDLSAHTVSGITAFEKG